MIKTVSELIRILRLMPPDAEPMIAYGLTADDIEGVECVRDIVYIGKLENRSEVTDQRTAQRMRFEELIEQPHIETRAEQLHNIEAVISGVATFDVPKDGEVKD